MESKDKKLILEYIFLCDYAFLTDNGKPGIIGIFDILGINNTPALHPNMYLYAHLKGEPNSQHSLELKVENPEGKSMIPDNQQKIILKFGSSSHGNFIHRFINFPIEKIGEYKFTLVADGKNLGSTNLQVMKVNNPNEVKVTN